MALPLLNVLSGSVHEYDAQIVLCLLVCICDHVRVDVDAGIVLIFRDDPLRWNREIREVRCYPAGNIIWNSRADWGVVPSSIPIQCEQLVSLQKPVDVILSVRGDAAVEASGVP